MLANSVVGPRPFSSTTFDRGVSAPRRSLMLAVLWHAGSLTDRTPPSRPSPSSEDDPLPGYQGPARVTLLVIDPYLVHAYWEVDPATIPESSHAVLRVYDTTGGASSYFDAPVSLPAKNWYIHLWTPERCYSAELGLIEEGGGFTPLARSNTIQTPRAWPVSAVPAAAPVAAVPVAPAETPQTEPQDSEPTAEPVPQPRESAPSPLPLVAAQQPDSILPSRAQMAPRQGAVPDDIQEPLVAERTEYAPSPPPRIPKPVDAVRLLRARLEQIYASLDRLSRVGEAAESPARGDVPNPSPDANPIEPGDLTQRAEEHFSAGVSSKTPKPPA